MMGILLAVRRKMRFVAASLLEIWTRVRSKIPTWISRLQASDPSPEVRAFSVTRSVESPEGVTEI